MSGEKVKGKVKGESRNWLCEGDWWRPSLVLQSITGHRKICLDWNNPEITQKHTVLPILDEEFLFRM